MDPSPITTRFVEGTITAHEAETLRNSATLLRSVSGESQVVTELAVLAAYDEARDDAGPDLPGCAVTFAALVGILVIYAAAMVFLVRLVQAIT